MFLLTRDTRHLTTSTEELFLLKNILGLKCLICGKVHRPDKVDYVCPDHGDEGILDVTYDYDSISRQFDRESLLQSNDRSIWRYQPLLPIHSGATLPPLSVGWTPLYPSPRLAKELGIDALWIKDDGRQPTASFKDRASAIAVVKAGEKGASLKRSVRQYSKAKCDFCPRNRTRGENRPTAGIRLPRLSGKGNL
jgi:threonine synthase